MKITIEFGGFYLRLSSRRDYRLVIVFEPFYSPKGGYPRFAFYFGHIFLMLTAFDY